MFVMQLPVSTGDLSLPQIDAAKISPLSFRESGAYGSWMLSDAGSLTDPVTGKVLTPQAAPASFASNYVRLTATLGNALLTDIDDSATPVQTFAMVFRGRGTKSRFLMGDGAAGDGSGVFINGTTRQGQIWAPSVQASQQSLWSGRVVTTEEWFFAAWVRDFASATRVHGAYLGGTGLSLATLNANAYVPAAAKLAFGNSRYNFAGTTADQIDVAEAHVWAGVRKSALELDAVYARAKVRCSARGITLP